MAERKNKAKTINDRAKDFLTPVSTYNLFPEIGVDLNLGKKPAQISYNITRLILSKPFDGIVDRRGISWDEPGNTVLVSSKRQGAELISLALQLQGFREEGVESLVESNRESVEYLKLTRKDELSVENGILMNKNIGGPLWGPASSV